MAIEIQGLDGVLERIEGIADAAKTKRAVNRACLLVERAAKQNAQAISSDEGLAGSIEALMLDDYSGIIHTPLFFAPYVEYGTGIEAEGGKGRQDVPWVFVKHSGREGSTQKSYTLEEAKQAMAILRGKGLDAYYTYGQKPQPFMRPALDDNRDRIVEILREGLLE